MQRFRSRAAGRVIFAASVGEEGLGNLCGIRQLMETWGRDVDTVIAVEGHGVDEIRHAGIGSTRLKVTFSGPGGHSWGAFGTPSAIHAMGTVIHKLSQFKMSTDPRTTFNVGLVEGGASVNTIAPRATMLVDLRSVSARHLAQLEARVTHLLKDVERHTGVNVENTVVGRRPAAALPVSHPLCRGIVGIRKHLRMRPAIFSAASTDANLPLSLGVPSVCLGITRGGLAHTVKEYIECRPHPGRRQATVFHPSAHPGEPCSHVAQRPGKEFEMTDGPVVCERRDGVVTLRLNRPDTLNAMNEAMMAEFERLLPDIAADSRCGQWC